MKPQVSLNWVAVLILWGTITSGVANAQTYVGSDACKLCHAAIWNDHRVSGHPHMLRKSAEITSLSVPLPDGKSFSDVSYVVGGYKWQAHFLDPNGYFITSTRGRPGKNQFNVATGEWVDDHAGEVNRPFDCGQCHTTGYSASGNQDGLPGIQGTWEFEGVQCERCHGPGSNHIFSPSPFNITIDDDVCQSCHVRGDPATIPASGGFVQNYEQYNEILASPHFDLDCSDCHDPHKKAEFSFKTECTTCHTEMEVQKQAFRGLGRRHLNRGVTCIECHMPYAAKSAVAVNNYNADVRSHQFRITLDPNATMFDGTGNFANGRLTPAFACLGCHENIIAKYAAQGTPLKAEQWARKQAKKIHK